MKQISSKRVKARKEHICNMCGSRIYASESYDLETEKRCWDIEDMYSEKID